MINMNIDDFKVPIIKKGVSSVSSLKNEFINKKIILFGVPGAFTPTCSETVSYTHLTLPTRLLV